MKNKKVTSLDFEVTSNEDFCAIWPQVKTGLETLYQLIQNPIAKKAIELVLVTGDTIAGNLCGR